MVSLSPDIPQRPAGARHGPLGPDRVSVLQHKAANWYAQHGLVDEAVRYALAAGERELAAHFIDQGLCDVLNREDCPTLERWLGLFAPEFIQARADLLIVQGFKLFLSWQLGALAKTVPRALPPCLNTRAEPLIAKLNWEFCAAAWPCYLRLVRTLAAIQAGPEPLAARP